MGRADEVRWNRAVLATQRGRAGGGEGGVSLAGHHAAPVMEQLLVLSGHTACGLFARDLVYSKSISQSKIKGNEKVLRSVSKMVVF